MGNVTTPRPITAGPPGPTYPFDLIKEKLLEADDDGRLSDKEAGIRLGVSERQIRRMREEGMTEWDLDRACVLRFGLLPFLVVGWDEWFDPELNRLQQAV